MMNGLLGELCTMEFRWKASTTAAESSVFVAQASFTKSQSLAIKTTSSKTSGSKKVKKDNRENPSCVHFGMVYHLKKNCWKL